MNNQIGIENFKLIVGFKPFNQIQLFFIRNLARPLFGVDNPITNRKFHSFLSILNIGLTQLEDLTGFRKRLQAIITPYSIDFQQI
jgi:hypothetical protein